MDGYGRNYEANKSNSVIVLVIFTVGGTAYIIFCLPSFVPSHDTKNKKQKTESKKERSKHNILVCVFLTIQKGHLDSCYVVTLLM